MTQSKPDTIPTVLQVGYSVFEPHISDWSHHHAWTFVFWLQYHTSPSTRNVFSISGKWDPAKAEGTNVSNRSTHARYPPQTFCKDSWVFLAAGSNLALKCETTWYTLMLKSVTNSNSTSTMVQFRWGSNCATPQAFRFFGAVDVQSLSIRITNRPNNFSLFVRWCCQGRVGSNGFVGHKLLHGMSPPNKDQTYFAKPDHLCIQVSKKTRIMYVLTKSVRAVLTAFGMCRSRLIAAPLSMGPRA